jgi:hypothetical protein
MSLVGLLIAVLVIAIVLYLISILPIDARIKQIATVLVVIVAIIWLLQVFTGPFSLGTHRIN